MAHQRGFTHWRGGRSAFVSLETWHMANKNSLAGEEKEGGVGWGARKCGTLQTRDLPGGGRGRDGVVRSETGGSAGRGLTCWRGGRGRSEREGRVCERERMDGSKKRSSFLEGRRRRRKLVSSETWHAGNEDLLSGGEEEGGTGW